MNNDHFVIEAEAELADYVIQQDEKLASVVRYLKWSDQPLYRRVLDTLLGRRPRLHPGVKRIKPTIRERLVLVLDRKFDLATRMGLAVELPNELLDDLPLEQQRRIGAEIARRLGWR